MILRSEMCFISSGNSIGGGLTLAGLQVTTKDTLSLYSSTRQEREKRNERLMGGDKNTFLTPSFFSVSTSIQIFSTSSLRVTQGDRECGLSLLLLPQREHSSYLSTAPM